MRGEVEDRVASPIGRDDGFARHIEAQHRAGMTRSGQVCDGPGFAGEAFGVLILGELDGDFAAQAGVARLVDLPHASGPQGD